eukprot:3326664-Heterocapsa_arctica.AAC.1
MRGLLGVALLGLLDVSRGTCLRLLRVFRRFQREVHGRLRFRRVINASEPHSAQPLLAELLDPLLVVHDLRLDVCLPGFLVPTSYVHCLDSRVSPDAELPPVLIAFRFPGVLPGSDSAGFERCP